MNTHDDDTADEIMVPLGRGDRFCFSCTRTSSCFNQCCRDLNQFLTPYDVLKIKHGLGISSSGFIQDYCSRHVGHTSGLPVLSLKPADPVSLICPFVTPEGCQIYAFRPSSCRIYPLARAISRSRETGRIAEHFMRIKEPHCLGHRSDHALTVNDWMLDQGLSVYNEMNDLLMEVIAVKNQLVPGPLDFKAQRFFFSACYDMDDFRHQVFENNWLKDLHPNPILLEQAKDDDTALLKIGMDAVKQFLLKEHAG